jgi:hypothetical protein
MDSLSGRRSRNFVKKPELGTGERFAQLKSKLASRPGVTNPGALAAYIGRKKLGAGRFNRLAAAGRKSAR